MTNHRRVACGVLVCLLAFAGAAAAQTEPAPVAATGLPTAPIGKMRVSFGIVPAPIGSFQSRAAGFDFSQDAAFAFGLRPAFDYSFNDYFFAGVSPQFLLNVKGKDANDAGKELDLLVRVGGHAPVADKLHLYGYLAPGYSIIYLPSSALGTDSASGFVLGVAAGAIYSVTDKFFAVADIGYQIGYQQITVADADFDFRLSYLLIGLGVGMKL